MPESDARARPEFHEYVLAPPSESRPPPSPTVRPRYVRSEGEKAASKARARFLDEVEETFNALEHMRCSPAQDQRGQTRKGILKVVVYSPFGPRRTAEYTSKGKWRVEGEGAWRGPSSPEEFIAAFAPCAFHPHPDAPIWEEQKGPYYFEREKAAYEAERAYLLARGYAVPRVPGHLRAQAHPARLERAERGHAPAPRTTSAGMERVESGADEAEAGDGRDSGGRRQRAGRGGRRPAKEGKGGQGDPGTGGTDREEPDQEGQDDEDEARAGARANAVGVADRAATGGTVKRPCTFSGADIGGACGSPGGGLNRALSGGGSADAAKRGLPYVHGDRLPISRYARQKRAGRAKKWVSRYTCSARFRDSVREAFPGLDRDPAYWSFIELLLFSSSRSHDRPILIPHELIADLCGFDPHYGGFRSGEFLTMFQHDVLPAFTYDDYDYEEGLVRQVADDGLPPWLLDALAEEMIVRPHELVDRVFFASGFSFDRKRDPKEIRALDLRDALRVELPTTPDQRFVQACLHELHLRSFSFLEDSFERAYELALAIPGTEARTQALNALQRIFVQPIPFYSPVRNSYRLFSIIGGLQQIHSPVRKALMAGCWDLDADALHLAVMARAWEIDELQVFLEEQGAAAIWRSVVQHVACVLHGREELTEEQFRAYKGALKHGVYALGYGGGPAKIAEQVAAHDDEGLFDDYDAVVAALKDHMLLGAVFDAKVRMLERIKTDFGMEGAYGWIPMQKGRNPLTVLAMASSSYEFALMRAVFDVAAEHDSLCTVLLYQYDGVTVRFRREADTAWLIEKMQNAFGSKAREFGISTRLSPERL